MTSRTADVSRRPVRAGSKSLPTRERAPLSGGVAPAATEVAPPADEVALPAGTMVYRMSRTDFDVRCDEDFWKRGDYDARRGLAEVVETPLLGHEWRGREVTALVLLVCGERARDRGAQDRVGRLDSGAGRIVLLRTVLRPRLLGGRKLPARTRAPTAGAGGRDQSQFESGAGRREASGLLRYGCSRGLDLASEGRGDDLPAVRRGAASAVGGVEGRSGSDARRPGRTLGRGSVERDAGSPGGGRSPGRGTARARGGIHRRVVASSSTERKRPR